MTDGLDLLLLDIDGVLVDARPSYDASSIEAVSLYLGRVLGFAGSSGTSITMDHILALKRAGGFNNDWHLCFALLRRVLARAPAALDLPDLSRTDGLEATLPLLQRVGPASGLTCEALLAAADLGSYGRELSEAGGGVDAVEPVCGPRHATLVLYGHDLDRDDLVTRIFQEVYLGSEQLRGHHGLAPLFGEREGLWKRERPLVSSDVLDALVDAVPLALVTGRPALEAELAIARTGLDGRIATLASEDDASAETARRRAAGIHPAEAGKPDPYLVHLALQRTGRLSGRMAFVGDLADDMLCARSAASASVRIEAVGVTWAAEVPAEAAGALRAAGADRVFEEPTQLLELVER